MLRFTNVDHQPTRLPPIYGYRTHPLLPLRQALDPILSRIDKLDDFIKVAKNECHYPSEHGLTRDESASIFIYTMDWGEKSLYRVLNETLRFKDRSVLVPWHGYLKLFETALEKLPNLQMNLWRGINLNISKNFKEDEKLTWWAFTSGSSAVKVVQQFLGPVSTLFMIEAKNGKDISIYSNFPEKEVILGLGTRVRVVSDALAHPSLNVVHLIELSDENDDELSSSFVNMTITQPVSSSVNTSVSRNSPTFKAFTYANGDRYEGEWKGHKKHGKGTYYYANGNKYIGDWVDDHETGQGLFTWTDGNRYEGQYKDGKKNGKGTSYYANGNKYIGDWVDDHRTGYGVFTWLSGNRYEGQYKHGKKNGKGTFYFANGEKYIGDWVDDHKTGQGLFTWTDGNRYEGQYKDGNMNGKGTYYYANGDRYTGDWVDDHKTGYGIFTWADGERYEGQLKDDKNHGKGTFYFANGDKYIGDWVDDHRTGYGVCTWLSGNLYEGQFKNDQMNGKGKMRYSDGQVKEGMWSNGNFIG